MDTEQLQAAFATARRVLSGVGPDQLGRATPCASWDVRALINHMVDAGNTAAEATERGSASELASLRAADGDFLAAYDDVARRCVGAFCAPGALEQTITLHFGEFPGTAYLTIVATDQFAHGWDLARATGQPSDIDPVLAEALLEAARTMLSPEFRGLDGQAPFGPEQPVAPDAREADRLAAFLGRRA